MLMSDLMEIGPIVIEICFPQSMKRIFLDHMGSPFMGQWGQKPGPVVCAMHIPQYQKRLILDHRAVQLWVNGYMNTPVHN